MTNWGKLAFAGTVLMTEHSLKWRCFFLHKWTTYTLCMRWLNIIAITFWEIQ